MKLASADPPKDQTLVEECAEDRAEYCTDSRENRFNNEKNYIQDNVLENPKHNVNAITHSSSNHV